MTRSVKEWTGKTDDTMPPPSVFRRLYRKQDGICLECTRHLVSGNITRDHIQSLILGGQNREKNLCLICTDPCSRKKSGEETSMKAKADRWLDKKMGFKAPSKFKRPPMPGARNSKWKRKLDGTVERR